MAHELRISRRLALTLGVAGGLGLAACGAPPASPTAAPKAAEPTKPAAAAPTTAPAAAPTTAPAAAKPAEPTKPAAAATAAPAIKPAGGTQTGLSLVGWNYEPPLVQQNIDRFKEQFPQYNVTYEPVAGEYLTAVIPKFQAKSPMDVIYVRDQYLAAWVDAGYLTPMDDFVGYKDYLKDVYPLYVQQTTYKGKNYGTWYYGDFQIMAYNNKMLNDAGYSKPPETLDELRKISEDIKKKGIAEFPLQMALEKQSDGMWDLWVYIKASGGRLLDDDGAPTYPDKDKVPEEILKWWVAAANEWKIVNAKADMEPLPAGALTAYRSAKAAFQIHSRYDMEGDNAPERSKVAIAGQLNSRMALPPALNSGGAKNTIGWTRFYGVPSHVKDKEGAWALAQYLGAKDKSGQYYTAKRWWLLRSLGYVFQPLEKDPEVQAKTKTFIHEPDLMNKAQQIATVRDGLQFSWWSEWYLPLQGVVQEAVLGKMTARDALVASANKANELRKK
ncbi:MAG: extracellular solute-binding protein [Chloroflexi bacterium]|nr:extracellular solute-binding protein [Chloroflexota bacterium]